MSVLSLFVSACSSQPSPQTRDLPADALAAQWKPVSGNPRASGVLPAGWSDQSAWCDATVTYSRGEESGITFLRIDGKGKGKAQLACALPARKQPGLAAFTISFKARTQTKAGMLFGIRWADHPEWSDFFHAAGLIEVPRQWQEFQVPIRGELPAGELWFCINFGVPGDVDIADLKIEPLALDKYTPTTTVPLQREPAAVEHHHKQDAAAKQAQPRIMFMGDSITDGWDGANRLNVWNKQIVPLGVVNFGIGANRVEHLLWQAEHCGLGKDWRPEVIVVLIGINNIFRIHSIVDIEEGMRRLLALLRQKSPTSRIIVQGVLPSGPETMPRREEIRELNRRYANLCDGKQVIFFDWGNKLLDADGKFKPGITADGTHLLEPGYVIWAENLVPVLTEMLGKFATRPSTRPN